MPAVVEFENYLLLLGGKFTEITHIVWNKFVMPTLNSNTNTDIQFILHQHEHNTLYFDRFNAHNNWPIAFFYTLI